MPCSDFKKKKKKRVTVLTPEYDDCFREEWSGEEARDQLVGLHLQGEALRNNTASSNFELQGT